MSNPIARRSGHVARPLDGDLVVLAPEHAVHRLGAVAAWVWTHADGSRDIDALVMGLRAELHGDADQNLVYEALDRLADAGLLEARVAPPAGVSRRVLLRRLVGASAAAALTAVLGVPLDAVAANAACEDDKAIIDALAWLEAEDSAVADFLDQWYDEALESEDTDDFYLKALGDREQVRKHEEESTKAQQAAAKVDLADCKAAPKQEKLGDKEERRKQHFTARRAQLAFHAERSSERRGKHRNRVGLQEEKRKADAADTYAKREKKAGDDALKEQEAKKSHDERLLRINEQEAKRLKQIEVRSASNQHEQLQKQDNLDSRQEASNKNIDGKLLQSEERAKVWSDHYAQKAEEQTSKDAGVTDRALEIAQEEALKAGASADLARAEANSEQKQKVSAEQENKHSEQKNKQSSEQTTKEAEQASEQWQKKNEQAAESAQKSELKQQEQNQKSSAEQSQKSEGPSF